MDHLPWLLERSAEMGSEPCGHALMASCPPEPFSDLGAEIPFGHTNERKRKSSDNSSKNQTPILSTSTEASSEGVPPRSFAQEPVQRTWELNKADLSTLLDLSKRLNLDGEITPVMAWGMISCHPRFAELNRQDFEQLAEVLKSKVRCYG